MRISATIIAVIAGLCAAPSLAAAAIVGNNTTAYNPNDSYQTTIPVTATVGAGCGFATGNAPDGIYDAGAVGGAWTLSVPFKLNCNVASRVGIISANGGLKSATTAATGYTNLAPYNVTLNLNGNAGVTATGTCAVSTLTVAAAGAGCTALYANPATSANGLKLNGPSNTSLTSTLVLNGTAASGILVASALYTDTLTVTIAASP